MRNQTTSSVQAGDPAPAAKRPRLVFHVPLDPARLLRVRHRVRDYLQAHSLPEGTIDDVVLALEEAMTNAVLHSGARGDLEICVGFEGRDLALRVKDGGRGFDPGLFDPHAFPDPLQSHGRGLYIIARLMDELMLRSENGLEVRATKRGALSEAQDAAVVAAPSPALPDSRWRALLEEIEEGFFALDWEYRYTACNQAYAEIVHRPVDDLIGRVIWDEFPLLCDTAAGEALHEAMELGRPAQLDYISPTFRRWFELRAYPTANGIAAYSRDIEERKRKEAERDTLFEELRTKEERLSLALSAAGLATWDRDFLTGNAVWNDEYYRMMGHEPGEVEPRFAAWLARIHPEDRKAADEVYRAALKRGGDYAGEFRSLWPDGTVRWLEVRGRIALDESGRPQRSYGVMIDTSERRAREAALAQSEQRYRDLLEHAGSAIIRWQPDGTILFFNEHAEALFGWRSDEVVGRHVGLLVPAVDSEGLDLSELASDIVAHPQQYVNNTNENLRRDGTRIWVSWTNRPLYDERGNLSEILAIGNDVTDQRSTYEALRESEEKLRVAFSHAAIGFALATPEGRFVDANAAFLSLMGYTLEELQTRAVVDVVHPDDVPENLELMRRMVAGEIEDFVLENRYLRKDGSPVWVRKSTSLARDEQRAPRWIIALVESIDERKRSELALQTSESFFQQTLESIPGMIFTTRPDGYCNYQSKQWVDYTGVPMSEHLGNGWTLLLHPDDRERAFAAWRDAVENGAPYDLEYRVRRRDGAYEWFSATAKPLRDSTGVITQWLGVALNIERLKRAEHDLRESEQRFRLALRNAPVSVAVQDKDLRYVWAFNQRNAGPEEIIGHTDAEIFTAEEAVHAGAIKRRVMAEDREMREQMWLQRPGGPMYLDVTWEPLHNEAGEVVGVGSATVDLTAMKLVEEALEQEESRFRTLFDCMEEGVALHEVIYDDAHRPIDYRILQVNAAYQRQSGVSGEKAIGALASELYGTGEPPYFAEFTHVAETGQPRSLETYFGPLGRHFRISVVSPKKGQFATVFEDITERKRNEAKLTALYDQQKDVLNTLQRGFRHEPASVAPLEVGFVEVPASTPELVGGDLWDLVELPDGRTLGLIGDVAGKGIGAATDALRVRTAVRAFAHTTADPGVILAKTSELLCGEHADASSFVTALVVILDPVTGRFDMASAGHPAPVHLKAGSSTFVEPAYGTPLGCFESGYLASQHRLRPNEGLVLYTDGLTEARRGGELFGEQRLLAACDGLHALSAQEVAEQLRSSAEGFGGHLRDDLAVLVLRLRP